MKYTEDQHEAINAINQSIDNFRGSIEPSKIIYLIVFLLMWAKYIPTSNSAVLGFFDVLERLTEEKISYISEELKKETGIDMSFAEQAISYNTIPVSGLNSSLERTREILLSAAKLLVRGDKEDIELIVKHIKFMSGALTGKRGNEGIINNEILEFSEKIFDCVADESKPINCLYSVGTSSAFKFAKKRDVSIFETVIFYEAFNKSLISLYGKPLKFNNQVHEPKDITFAAPPLGLKTGADYFYLLPFEENSDSLAISDLPCKMMYLAHQNTKKLTILITSLGTLFSKVNGMSYFRKRIVENNWLDTIIKFPQNSFAATPLPLVMIILKKGRSNEDKFQFIDFSNCKNISESKIGLKIPDEEIEKLLLLYKNKKESKISKLASKSEIQKYDYNLNLHKYILSREQESINRLLSKREIVKLGEIVTFIRPLFVGSKVAKSGPEINEIILSDIDSIGEISNTDKALKIREDFFSKTKFPFVRKDDLVISIKGTVGKIGYITQELTSTIPGPSLCVLRVNESSIIKSKYLFQYLFSDLGQKVIISASQGGSIPFLAIDDLKNLPIPIPTIEEQSKAKKLAKRSRELFESIEKMQKELNKCTNSGWLQIDKENKEEKE